MDFIKILSEATRKKIRVQKTHTDITDITEILNINLHIISHIITHIIPSQKKINGPLMVICVQKKLTETIFLVFEVDFFKILSEATPCECLNA